MSDSIFDPSGPNTEDSGSRNLGPAAGNISHLPFPATDGKVDDDDGLPDQDTDTREIARAEMEIEGDESTTRKLDPD